MFLCSFRGDLWCSTFPVHVPRVFATLVNKSLGQMLAHSHTALEFSPACRRSPISTHIHMVQFYAQRSRNRMALGRDRLYLETWRKSYGFTSMQHFQEFDIVDASSSAAYPVSLPLGVRSNKKNVSILHINVGRLSTWKYARNLFGGFMLCFVRLTRYRMGETQIFMLELIECSTHGILRCFPRRLLSLPLIFTTTRSDQRSVCAFVLFCYLDTSVSQESGTDSYWEASICDRERMCSIRCRSVVTLSNIRVRMVRSVHLRCSMMWRLRGRHNGGN